MAENQSSWQCPYCGAGVVMDDINVAQDVAL